MNKTDVLLMTYNSAKYLDECLNSIVKTIPYNRIIVVDHHSADRTLEILAKYPTEIHYEDVGLGYARQLSFDLSETETVTCIDSDIVFYQKDWFQEAYELLYSDPKIGVVVARPSDERYETARQKYANFWWKFVPASRKFGMTLGSTLIKREVLEGLKIPFELDCREDRYLEIHAQKLGYRVDFTFIDAVHYFDHHDKKGSWAGANTRLMIDILKDPDFRQKNIAYIFLRRVAFSWLKAIPPAIYHRDLNIISWNTRHWIDYMKGWMHPDKYRKLKRKPEAS